MRFKTNNLRNTWTYTILAITKLNLIITVLGLIILKAKIMYKKVYG